MQKRIPSFFRLLALICAVFNASHAIAAIKIACVGDSITYSVRYPTFLAQNLGSAYEVSNFGVPGTTMLKATDSSYWNTSNFTASSTYLPDIVIIMLGTNDSKAYYWTPYGANYQSDYMDMILHYQGLASHPSVYIMTSPPNFGPGSAQPAVIADQIVPTVRALSVPTGCELIDIFTTFNGHPEWFGDGTHPNTWGSQILAGIVTNVIQTTRGAPRNGGLFEAELQAVSGSTQNISTINPETGYSGGNGLQYIGTATGDYVTLRLGNVAAGSYNVVVGYKTDTSHAVVQVSGGTAGGTLTNVGGAIDEYSATSNYTSSDLGTWTATASGDQDFRFQITGHNANSTGYTTTIDYIKLTPCVAATAGGSWQNTAMTAQTGTFTATFDATPSASPSNSVVALSNGAQTAYASFSCLARFNPTGQIDAYNGTAFAAASSINYSAGVSYHFRLVVNVATQTYSTYVTPAGGSELTVGTNYAFRAAATSLNNWGVFVNGAGSGTDTVSNFAAGTATITATGRANGSISPWGLVTVNQGSNKTFTITPYEGFHISAVTVDGVNVGAVSSYTFSNVQANHTIEASFAVTTFTITASAGTGGSISPSGAVTENWDSRPTFTITPNSGFSVSDVKVDGTSVGAVTSYSFSNVEANHTISATFASTGGTTFTITASAGSNGSISPTGAVTVAQGGSQSFTITPNSGFSISNVTVDGASVGAVSSYTFSNVQANHTISATFGSATSTEINDTDAGIVYTGTWSYSANRTHGEYQADVHYTATNGDSVSYTFNGTGISYITETYTDEGNVSFYIDGVFQQTVSCVSSTRVAQVAVFTASGLASGSHTLKAVKVDGTYMLLDALIYTTSSSSPVAAPTFTPGGGTYSSTQSVSIASTTSGATIRYTVDGSTPSETNGTIYTGPVVISSNTTLKAIAYKSGMTDSTVTSATYAFTVTLTSANGFYNQALPAAKTGTFTAQFDASASISPSNSLIGLSQGNAAAYTDIAASVRFNPTGDIDARNGSAFAAASTIPFTAGTSYHFRLVINVTAHTYSAYVTPAGGSEILIGSNYAFRTEQAGVTQLDTWNADVNATPGGSLTVSNVVTQ
jgi:lysophospholipase L1-like esterase